MGCHKIEAILSQRGPLNWKEDQWFPFIQFQSQHWKPLQKEPAKKHRPLSSSREEKLVLKKSDGFAKKVSIICIYI